MGAARNAAGQFVKAGDPPAAADPTPATPAVGDVVDFEWTDTLLGVTRRRRGVVLEVGELVVHVTPLAEYALPVPPSQIG